MQATKFWIVEYVDVNAPKIERSELCLTLSEAKHRLAKRNGFLHYETVEAFAGWGLCDSPQNSTTFYNQAS